MKKIIITMFAAAAISFSYLRHRNMDLAQLTDLQLANIEALANNRSKYLVQKRKTQNVSF